MFELRSKLSNMARCYRNCHQINDEGLLWLAKELNRPMDQINFYWDVHRQVRQVNRFYPDGGCSSWSYSVKGTFLVHAEYSCRTKDGHIWLRRCYTSRDDGKFEDIVWDENKNIISHKMYDYREMLVEDLDNPAEKPRKMNEEELLTARQEAT